MNIQQMRRILARLRYVIDTALAFIGYVNSIFILSLLFFLVVVPIGLLFRLSGKSVFKKVKSGTHWIERDGAVQLDKPF